MTVLFTFPGLILLFLAYKILKRVDANFCLLAKRDVTPGSWQGKTVWVVGASQGVGKLLADYFARNGARVILSSRNEAKLKVRQRLQPYSCACALMHLHKAHVLDVAQTCIRIKVNVFCSNWHAAAVVRS